MTRPSLDKALARVTDIARARKRFSDEDVQAIRYAIRDLAGAIDCEVDIVERPPRKAVR